LIWKRLLLSNDLVSFEVTYKFLSRGSHTARIEARQSWSSANIKVTHGLAEKFKGRAVVMMLKELFTSIVA